MSLNNFKIGNLSSENQFQYSINKHKTERENHVIILRLIKKFYLIPKLMHKCGDHWSKMGQKTCVDGGETLDTI